MVNAVAFSLDGNTIVHASDDSTIKLWEKSTRSLLKTIEVNQNFVMSLVFSPDGNMIISVLIIIG